MLEKVILWPGHISGRIFLSSLSQQLRHEAKWIYYSTGCHRQTLVLSSNLSSVNSNLFQTTQRSMTSPAPIPRKEKKVGAHLVYHQYHPEETDGYRLLMLVPRAKTARFKPNIPEGVLQFCPIREATTPERSPNGDQPLHLPDLYIMGLSWARVQSRLAATKSTCYTLHWEIKESGKTPLVLFLPWITANRRSAQRFEDLYGIRGFNVLTVWSNAMHFLWPKSAVPLADEVLKYLLCEVESDLVIHGMSIGAYIYSVILMEAIKNQEAASYFKQRVKGNVFDSLVCGGLNQMAIGVSKLVFKNFVMEKVLTATLLSYFAMAKSHTVEEYNRAIQQFFDNPFTPSALIFYSTVDRMSDPNMVEDIGRTWEKKGAHLRMKKWEDAGHVELFKKHPSEYVEILDEYVAFIRPSVRLYKPVAAKL